MISEATFGLSGTRARVNASAGWAIVVAAAGLGVVGDLLLRTWPLGVNATIWLAALCVVAAVLPRIKSLDLPHRGTAWLAAALALSVMLTWRASPVLQALNALAVFLCLGMVAFPTTAKAIRRAGVAEHAANLVVSIVHAVVGAAVLLGRDLDWRLITFEGRKTHAAAIGRGLAVAAVPVIVFGALFASADVFFRDVLHDVLVVVPREAIVHLMFSLFFAWLAGSYLWGALVADRAPAPETPRLPWLRLEFIETGVVFGLVNALFLAFVAVQFRYLFGGADRVESSSTLTYAEYARRGFFELVAVAALAVPFLLLTHWLLARGQLRLQRLYALFAALLIVLVFVVMASALERMRLYQETFGLTELRLYTTAFMFWLFAVFAWLAFTVLRGQRDRFPFGVFMAGLAVLVGLNAVNPDALIVRRNVALDRPFDSAYALGLSADAVPAFVANFDAVPEAERCAVARELRRRYLDAGDDWRTWNWGRDRARDAVSSSHELAAACDAGARE